MSVDRKDNPVSFGGSFIDSLEVGGIDPNFSFALNNERDTSGQPIEGEAQWLKLQHEGKSVEGKFYTPANQSNDTLILFEPGMPGDSVVWMEEKHVPALLKAGYTIMALRHRGTRIDVEKADNYIHCPERIAKGAEKKMGTLNDDREHGVSDMMDEPAIALAVLGHKFKEIKLVGHSIGTPFLVHSLESVDPAIRAKIKNLVSLAGHIGGSEGLAETFPGSESYYDYCKQYLNMGDAKYNVRAADQMFKEIYNGSVPEHIMITQVYSPADEYVSPKASERFHKFLGRGLKITDETQFESEFHDLKNLRPETLLRLLKMHYPKASHSVTLKSRNPATSKG